MAHVPVVFSAAVEGPTDEVVLRRIVESCGAALGVAYGKTGKAHLLTHLHHYNQAANFSPWIVLIDLDQDANCAPTAKAAWLATPATQMCFRIAVRAVESWLLADRESLAAFLSISESHIPVAPETLNNPKETLVNLARRSRRRRLREEMAPRPSSGRPVGPAYTSRLIEYTLTYWRPDVAARHADSLLRLCQDITESVSNWVADD
ncbi:MAG: DUF4276 family protein [Caldilinea sp.]|jgi:hypothetical protein|nr:DUF4276 family protein [Caldilinea sp.]